MKSLQVALAIAVASSFLSLVQGTSADPAAKADVRLARTASAPTTVRYLYVSDYFGVGHGGHAVSRFRIGKDGMPASVPDLTLDGGVVTPSGMAVDGEGHLFVADDTLGLVFEFAHGASGNAKPIRTLALPDEDDPQLIAVDNHDDLFAQDLSLNVVDVFRPNAQGNDPPVHTILNWNAGGAPLRDLVTDSAGRLFVGILDGPILVYDDPERKWREPSSTLIFPTPSGYDAAYSLVILDESAGQMYVPIFPIIQQPWHDDFLRAPIVPSSGAIGPAIFTKDCRAGGPISGVVSGAYLLLSCNGSPSSVLVYKKNVFGRQRLLNEIGRFQSPNVIRIGP